MGIPKLPVPVPVLCNPRKEATLIHTVSGGIHADFVIRGREYRKFGSEWIDAQILAPVELHVVYSAREVLNSRGCGCAGREYQVTLGSHEERGAVGEMPTPSRRTLLRDILGDSVGEYLHVPLDCRGPCRRQGLRGVGQIVVGATRYAENNE
jgi:hypothetical protein